MTPTPDLRFSDQLRFTISTMIDTHGLPRVLLAVVQALFKPPPKRHKRRNTGALSNHIRRDIGLPVNPAQPPHWAKYR